MFISLRSCLNQSFLRIEHSSGFALDFVLQTVPKRRYKSHFDVGINHPAVNIETKPSKPTGSGTVHDLPHRVRMRTTNGLERLNKEIKRRTRVACLFPNPESCLRLVSALLCEQDEDWASGKIYLTMKPDNTTK